MEAELVLLPCPLGSLLPFPPGVSAPVEEDLNGLVRNRALLLDGDVKAKNAEEKVRCGERVAPQPGKSLSEKRSRSTSSTLH